MTFDIVVQKFGGTSVETKQTRKECIAKIKKELSMNKKVVVVVSAMGRKGSPYATDTLLSLSPTISGREKDLLMNAGETISACVFSEELKNEGINNTVLTGGQAGVITDDTFNNATITKVEPKRILQELETKNVVVVTGFQGKTANNDITTLGRGGSDTSAVALGIGLNAEKVEIYTDVEGIMTTDPKITNDAKVIKEASYNEILNLSYSGSRVIHPRAVELAMNHNVKLIVKSTFSNGSGTLIHNKIFKNNSLENKSTLFTGISLTKNLVKFDISADKAQQNLIFEEAKNHSISLDMIKIDNLKVIFVVEDKNAEIISRFLTKQDIEFNIAEKMAKIALIGEKIAGVSGVISEVVKTLYRSDIDIFHATDSNTTLWFLVEEKNAKKGVCELHKKFFN